jgi:hypothetical protein
MNLTLFTPINSIILVDRKTNMVFNSSDMNMSLVEWIMKTYENCDLPVGYKLPDLTEMDFHKVLKGTGNTSKGYTYEYTYIKHEDSNYHCQVVTIDSVSDKPVKKKKVK